MCVEILGEFSVALGGVCVCGGGGGVISLINELLQFL